MNLADDLRILRELRVRHKATIIQWTAHLYIHHADAMCVIDEKALANIIHSDKPIEELIKCQ